MTREQAKELLPIIQAFAEGKEIEIKTKKGSEWDKLEEDDMQYIDFKKCDLRIKPADRPFKNAYECWNEMLKHQPFGWLKAPYGYFMITGLNPSGVTFGVDDTSRDYKYMCNECTFVDGTLFGIKE